MTLRTASQPPSAEGLVDRGLQRQRLAAAHLAVRADDQARADVDDALLQRLGREAAEHDRMGDAEPRAGLHRDDRLDRHRHVDDRPVALLVAQLLQAVGELADPLVQRLVGDLRDLAVVGLEDDRGLVLDGRADMAIETVCRRIQLAIVEPLEERLVRFVERAGEGLVSRAAAPAPAGAQKPAWSCSASAHSASYCSMPEIVACLKPPAAETASDGSICRHKRARRLSTDEYRFDLTRHGVLTIPRLELGM